jgi:twitching motility protein PilJ
MAIKLGALNIGFGKPGGIAKVQAPAKKAVKVKVSAAPGTSIMDDIGAVAKKPLPLIGQWTFARQMKVLGATLALLLVLIGFVVATDANVGTQGTAYVSAAGEMRMLSQRLAKEAQQGLQGAATAFPKLQSSKDTFSRLLVALTNGGEIAGTTVSPSPADIRPALKSVTDIWTKMDKDAVVVLNQQKNLVALGEAVKNINNGNPQLLDLAEQVQALKLQTQAGAREIALSGQLVMLTQRMAKNANNLLAADIVDPEVTFLLGKDSNSFRDILLGLSKGSEMLRVAPARDEETIERLKELDGSYAQFRGAVAAILGNLQSLVNAKAAGRNIVSDSEKLLTATDELATAYQEGLRARRLNFVAMGIAALFAFLIMGLMIKAYRDDTVRRAGEEKRMREDAETKNKSNQEAILRLMNEMGSLADGDLTVQATVSEDITGAIADSVNYTVEELRVLVGRINSASAQVTAATESAQATSVKLLQAAEKQSQEIQDTSASVLRMARAINEVSASASRSVGVAQQSLSAAEKGQDAVTNSITGMNEIREQIQETSKRIKRLGESSQEIGEIVELISDITEQTNVLALNAAIQAASAGEAGRGFTVVAEEVQRLAERSGEATKQIGAIVKTIQTDTQDAVAAMEQSTQGVVEGARLSDNAGQALSEIGEVSRRLAQLIEEISVTAQAQAQAAGVVATNMQDILSVTKQTTEGTKQTAVSVGQLAKLAQELKGSVANFKIN